MRRCARATLDHILSSRATGVARTWSSCWRRRGLWPYYCGVSGAALLGKKRLHPVHKRGSGRRFTAHMRTRSQQKKTMARSTTQTRTLLALAALTEPVSRHHRRLPLRPHTRRASHPCAISPLTCWAVTRRGAASASPRFSTRSRCRSRRGRSNSTSMSLVRSGMRMLVSAAVI